MNISKKVTLSSVSVDSNQLDIRLTIGEEEKEAPKDKEAPKKLAWIAHNRFSDTWEVHTNDSKGDELKECFDMAFNSKGGYVNQGIIHFINALVKEGYIFIGVR